MPSFTYGYMEVHTGEERGGNNKTRARKEDRR